MELGTGCHAFPSVALAVWLHSQPLVAAIAGVGVCAALGQSCSRARTSTYPDDTFLDWWMSRSDERWAMFTPGNNIAMKVPPHQVADTVRFYGEVLGLEQAGMDGGSVGFHFGDKVLWVDSVPGVSQAELWLEVQTDDLDAAAAHLEAHGVTRCDSIEPLGDFPGFWITAPSQIIHLIANESKSEQ